MFYRILVNGKELGDFGREDLPSIHVSVGGTPGKMCVFVSAVSDENARQFHYDWLQKELGPGDRVEIIPATESVVPDPRNTFVAGRRKPEPSEV